MPPDPKLPRGSLKLATEALTEAALLNNAGYLPGDEQMAAWIVLDATLPAIRRADRRDLARHILALDEEDQARHRQGPNKGPWNDMRTSLRRLARGESLPDIPPKEAPDG